VRSIGNLASVDNLGILIFKDAIFDERGYGKEVREAKRARKEHRW